MLLFKYHRTIFYGLSFLFILSGSIAFGQDGKISEVHDYGNWGYLIVNIRGEGTLWVGCTVYPSGLKNKGVDFKPVEVKGDSEAKINVFSEMNSYDERLEYVVTLWKDKISLKECEKKHGKGSKHCEGARRNGFQMEGPLDRKQGIYQPGFD